MKPTPRGVLIVDLGAQYAQLIARRVREAGTWCEIAPPSRALDAAKRMDLGGIILSGGPASVYAEDAPDVPRELLDLVPHAHYEVLDQAGHMVAGDRNTIFTEAVLNFLNNPSCIGDAWGAAGPLTETE